MKRPAFFWPGLIIDVAIIAAIFAGLAIIGLVFTWFVESYLQGVLIWLA